jgi:hypothetical protein
LSPPAIRAGRGFVGARKKGVADMVYDFACKIKDIQNHNLLEEAEKEKMLTEIHKNHSDPMAIKLLVVDNVLKNAVLVKTQASVSSMPGFLDIELTAAIDKFKSYLDEIAAAVDGAVSTNEGFYNNSKTFNKLY